MESGHLGALDKSDEILGEVETHDEISTDFRHVPTPLFDLGQINVDWEEDTGTLWAFLTPAERPNCNMPLLRDAITWQTETKRVFGHPSSPLKYMVLGSRFPGIFNLGGDLEMFADCIERRDREALLHYGGICIEFVHRVWHNNNMPIINIALTQGDALGGGFEAMLTFDVIIAERQARFGLPEILFGLFPGMGAYSLLARRLGRAMAEKIILGGKVYTAQEMYDMGIVSILVDEGEGEQAVRDYIRDTTDRHAGYCGIYRAGRQVDPLHIEELTEIVENWADTALKLTPKDLKLMRRLAAAQARLPSR
ncbi:MAG: crotonase/enoyl-CoA hydratase family protein [Alphaproteobacteria bacterium]|nr:crotonase/enoyl-CoA hydratase family protein [Alphaproteobacteria bacterium]